MKIFIFFFFFLVSQVGEVFFTSKTVISPPDIGIGLNLFFFASFGSKRLYICFGLFSQVLLI